MNKIQSCIHMRRKSTSCC